MSCFLTCNKMFAAVQAPIKQRREQTMPTRAITRICMLEFVAFSFKWVKNMRHEFVCFGTWWTLKLNKWPWCRYSWLQTQFEYKWCQFKHLKMALKHKTFASFFIVGCYSWIACQLEVCGGEGRLCIFAEANVNSRIRLTFLKDKLH